MKESIRRFFNTSTSEFVIPESEDMEYSLKPKRESEGYYRFDIFQRGEYIGHFYVQLNREKNRAMITLSWLVEDKRWKPEGADEENKGIGTGMYKKLIRFLKFNGYTVYSSADMRSSPLSSRIWEKLTEAGLVKEDPPGSGEYFST